MSAITEIDDDGFVAVKLAGAEQRLDLWHVNNRLVELREQHESAPANAFNEAVIAYLVELGYPRVSTKAALKFARAIFEAVAGPEKKGESPESPSPSAS